MDTQIGLRPFVACNIGTRVSLGGDDEVECKGFFVEPQVGVDYKKFSLTAGFDVAHWNEVGYDDETWSGNSLNLRVGYHF